LNPAKYINAARYWNQLGNIVNFVRNTFKTTMVWQQRQHTTVRFENKRIEDTMSQAQGAQTA
jgi:hypothetical protein